MAEAITLEALQEQFTTLPLTTVLNMLDKYQEETGVNLEKRKRAAITADWETRLIALGINSTCPYCGSQQIAKYGSNGNTKRFQCKKCKKTFSLFTGTILEKTKYDWLVWVKVVELLLDHKSIETIRDKLEKDFKLKRIDYKTIYTWRHKIMHAIAEKPMPKLSGVIQVDETFFHESQKGSQHLISYIKGEERLPSSEKSTASYGINGNEFANVVALIDATGHCVAKVVGLGSLTYDTFVKEFDEYIEKPTFICSDGNYLYKRYCEERNIPLYILPSAYKKRLKEAGFVKAKGMSAADAEKAKAANLKILEDLYNKKEIDRLEFLGSGISYKQFKEIKRLNGLSLGKVNRLHGRLKNYIEIGMRNVTTKFLPDYVAFEVYLRNWKADHGSYPNSETEAEQILIDILKPTRKYTKKDINSKTMDLPVKSDKSIELLRERTLEARKSLGDDEFEFDEEDGVISFDRRKFLEKLPQYRLDGLRKKYKIPKKFVKYSIISELLKKETINDDIYHIIAERKDKEKRAREKKESQNYKEQDDD